MPGNRSSRTFATCYYSYIKAMTADLMGGSGAAVEVVDAHGVKQLITMAALEYTADYSEAQFVPKIIAASQRESRHASDRISQRENGRF